jgi:hypothetical protein
MYKKILDMGGREVERKDSKHGLANHRQIFEMTGYFLMAG